MKLKIKTIIYQNAIEVNKKLSIRKLVIDVKRKTMQFT